MPACPKCSGMLKVPAKSATAPGIAYVDCDCVQTDTPGRVPHSIQINYPPEVIQALQQAGTAQQAALGLQQQSDPSRIG